MFPIILFDTPTSQKRFMPFTFTRPVAYMRLGILTIAEKWEMYCNTSVSTLSANYLQEKFPTSYHTEQCYISGQALPTPSLLHALEQLKPGQALYTGEQLVAFKDVHQITDYAAIEGYAKGLDAVSFTAEAWLINYRWELFQQNRKSIIADFELLTAGRESQPISDPYTKVYGDQIFLEEGATVMAAILNSNDGPIYIGKNATVHEGSIIKGAFALCESAHVNMAAKIKGDTTIGPHCKVGGEVSNSILFGYSNKGHDGFMGNSVIGEWCNLGADTNTSNLKNNYGSVNLWDYEENTYTSTEQQFCGTMMGDHAKCGINTMLNTGTVVGVCANTFGGDFQKQYVPSFSWGNRRYATFRLEKAFEVAERVMARRKVPFTEADQRLFEHIFEMTEEFRK